MAIAIALSRVVSLRGALSLCALMNVFARNPTPPRISAPPTTFWKLSMLLALTWLATSTPTSDMGAEPASIQVASRACDRAEHSVPCGAERLEDRAVEDVGADRDLRVETEEEDQDRGHQAAATHPGHADEDPHEQACERELPGHAGLGGSGQETNGLPVRRQPSL